MTHLTNAIDLAISRFPSNLEELKAFASIPSVSTDPIYNKSIRQCAKFIANKLIDLHFNRVEIFPTEGHPIVYGEKYSYNPHARTILVYGHYDVQPADPVDEWETAPFDPQIRGENIYARGASDMKGQIIAVTSAIEAIVSTGTLPINIKFLIEGEEEISSPNLANFIQENKDMLSCDFALNPDTGMLGKDIPSITYALRGLAYFQLKIFGPRQDLHSGLYGGVVHNPAQVLSGLIAGMHDDEGRITLPGFYDSVETLSDEERFELSKLQLTEDYYIDQTGVNKLWGEEGFSPVERVGARPTLEINGLYSGFIGEGKKTVLPRYAMAKMSMRLVPHQNPDDIHTQLTQYLEEKMPETVTWELEYLGGDPASICPYNSLWVDAYIQASLAVWNKKPLFRREGGSVPVVSYFKEILGVESLNIGFGLPSDNLHGPNEKLHIPTFQKGIIALIHFMFNIAKT